jgi:4a-hydroxytetrahydrobiopterin dehydratase
MTIRLAEKTCIPCKAGTPPLKPEEVAPLMELLDGGWLLVDGDRLEKEYRFKNFRRALDFVNRVGDIAEHEGHHPDIHLSWGKVRVALWTHVAAGLTENDFILAAKSDRAFETLAKRAMLG